jgi:hypothetical protein
MWLETMVLPSGKVTVMPGLAGVEFMWAMSVLR